MDGLLDYQRIFSVARAAMLIGVGIVGARLAGRAVAAILGDLVDNHVAVLVRRAVVYTIGALFLVAALHQLGFNLSVLLGAAGILTVAVGFASQTSASNLVSGLFLIVEHPFAVGDVIKVADTTGEVLAIDLLAIKLRTFDNLYVRIPNETIIKSQITNLTRFDIRRFDMQLGVAYKEDLERVRDVLMEVADRNPLSLEEPKPLFIVQGFGDSAVNLQFSVWAMRSNFLELRNSMQMAVKRAFDETGIEIPFPHRSIYAGSATAPIPVRIADTPSGPDAEAAAEK